MERSESGKVDRLNGRYSTNAFAAAAYNSRRLHSEFHQWSLD